MKCIIISIQLESVLSKSDLELRNLFVDTLEGRGLGCVVEVTSSANRLEVILSNFRRRGIKKDITKLLISLGFRNFEVNDIILYW